jgi:hypothetical protein
MNELCAKDYPYEIIPLRYNIGSDNGPADSTLSLAVKAWNEKYITPSIRITTVTESFSEFEERYAEKIPAVSGAFTGYWEDGAASSALETAMTRSAAENINMASALIVIKNRLSGSSEKFDEAWRNVLLFNEHTWGSWNSISEPENPFTLSQWKNKKQFALDALSQSSRLLTGAIGNQMADKRIQTDKVEIINTHSWAISDLVSLPAEMKIKGTRVIDQEGHTIPSQLLSNGDLVFVARNIPPLGSRIFTLENEPLQLESYDKKTDKIETENFLLRINPESGAIADLIMKKKNLDLVDHGKPGGLNSWQYVEGRSPSAPASAGNVKYEVSEKGRVTSVIELTANAAGTGLIRNRYQLIEGLDKVNIVTEINKKNVYTPESVHLGFPLNIPSGIMNIDLAFGTYRPDAGQIKAACKNYFTPERYVDISNQDFGVTWITRDAPLIEIGKITTDATAFGWISDLSPSQTFYSYAMNNYWETNYKASQEGMVRFRYSLHPHAMYISSEAEKLAFSESEPLIVIPADEKTFGFPSLFTIKSSGIIVTALVPVEGGYLVRLFNAGGNPSALEINWQQEPADNYFCDFDGNKTGDFKQGLIIPAWGLRTLRVRR